MGKVYWETYNITLCPDILLGTIRISIVNPIRHFIGSSDLVYTIFFTLFNSLPGQPKIVPVLCRVSAYIDSYTRLRCLRIYAIFKFRLGSVQQLQAFFFVAPIAISLLTLTATVFVLLFSLNFYPCTIKLPLRTPLPLPFLSSNGPKFIF